MIKILGIAALALMTTVASAASKENIVDTAASAGSFKTLVKAIQVAGLTDTLKGPGPFTVFAPTDEAFAKLPPGTLDSLLQPENRDKLRSILTYHVVPGAVDSANVAKLTSAKTVEGSNVTVAASTAGVMVDNAKVIKPDIHASNGIIHVIDSVILPGSKTKE